MKKPYIKSVAVLAISLGLFSCDESKKSEINKGSELSSNTEFSPNTEEASKIQKESYKVSKIEEKKLEQLEKRLSIPSFANNESKLNAEMKAAAMEGYAKVVERLIDAGADPTYDNTITHAAANGQTEVVKVLIGAGADVNVVFQSICTPLEIACIYKKYDMVQALIEAGAIVDARPGEKSALSYAVVAERIDALKYFLSVKSANNIDVGESANIVKLLLDHGANVNYKDTHTHTALMYAAKNGGNKEVAKLLIDHGASVNEKDIHGITPLIYASESGNIELVKLLIEHGAIVNEKDKNGRNALQASVKRGGSEVVAHLLKHGAYISPDTMHLAVEHGRIDELELYLKNGADVDMKDNWGITLLLRAVQEKQEGITKLLLAHKANVNVKDEHGNSPLILVIDNWGNEEIAKSLIQAGADVNVKDDGGMTALMYAVGDKRSIDLIKLLIQSGADVSARNNKSIPSIIFAVASRYAEAIELLIQSGANVNVKSGEGSALEFAVDRGDVEMVKFLIQMGADVNEICYIDFRNKTLSSILDYVCNGILFGGSASVSQREEIAKILIEAGAMSGQVLAEDQEYSFDKVLKKFEALSK